MTTGIRNTSSNQAQAYLRTRVMSASPEELRLLLLEGAIKFGKQGLEGLVSKDHEAAFTGISQCRNIIFELLTTIRDDIDPSLAANVKGLYTFMYTQSIEASHEKDTSKLTKVIELLEYERETWIMLMERLAGEKVATLGASPHTHAAPSRQHDGGFAGAPAGFSVSG